MFTTAVEHITQNPLLWASVAASLVGLTAWYLYGGFLEENYTKIKWFRRLFLPWITPFLENLDEDLDDTDLSRLYVETTASDEELMLEYEIPREDYDNVMNELGDFFLDNNFRPEVILASLGTDEDGNREVGNWVLTAPERTHTDRKGVNRIHEVLLMVTSKWQLHVRVFYDEDGEKLRFYPHYEKNPYNPLMAKDHFNSVGLDIQKGKSLFARYSAMLKDDTLQNYEYNSFPNND